MTFLQGVCVGIAGSALAALAWLWFMEFFNRRVMP